MKVCIVGAGAIGASLGVLLARNGCAVSVLARASSLATLQGGLTRVHDEVRETVPVAASAIAAELGPQDLVVLAVKAPALPALVASLPPLLTPRTTLLTVMNGVPWWFLQGRLGGPLSHQDLASVDPDGCLRALHPAEQIVGGVIHGSFSTDAPGVSRAHGDAELILGESQGGLSSRLQQLAGLFAGPGMRVRLSPQIQRDIWLKVWGNMTLNPISALTCASLRPIMEDPLAVDFITRVMAEARRIGEWLGLVLEETPEQRVLKMGELGDIRTSMLQDVEQGRPLEIDAILASVRELGALAGLATPYTDALLALIRLKGRALRLYPAAR